MKFIYSFHLVVVIFFSSSKKVKTFSFLKCSYHHHILLYNQTLMNLHYFGNVRKERKEQLRKKQKHNYSSWIKVPIESGTN